MQPSFSKDNAAAFTLLARLTATAGAVLPSAASDTPVLEIVQAAIKS